jgi:hypothetical protein
MVASIDIYDPATVSWSVAPMALPKPRYGAAVHGVVFTAAATAPPPSESVTASRATPSATTTVEAGGGVAAVVTSSHRILVIGGWEMTGPVAMSSIWDGRMGAWSSLPALPLPCRAFVSALL